MDKLKISQWQTKISAARRNVLIVATLTAYKRHLFLSEYIKENATRQRKQPKTAGAFEHVGKFVANTETMAYDLS